LSHQTERVDSSTGTGTITALRFTSFTLFISYTVEYSYIRNSFVVSMEHNDVSIYMCRICLEEGERESFIAPCKCSGSQKWVHRTCLNRWRSVCEDRAFSQCTECLSKYELYCPAVDHNRKLSCHRTSYFLFLVLRDFMGVFLAFQVVVIMLGLLVYAIDHSSHALLQYFRQQNRPVLFYYFVGHVLIFSFLGMGYSAALAGCLRSDDHVARSGRQCTLDGTDYLCFDLVCRPCIYSPIGPNASVGGTMDCCCCCPTGAGGGGDAVAAASGSGADSCGCSCCCELCAGCGRSASGGSGCGECVAGTSAGEECAAVMFVAVLVFAVLGAVISIVIGIVYMQHVVRAHYHVLYKFSLTTEYIVRDLAAGGATTDEGGGGGPVDDHASPAAYASTNYGRDYDVTFSSLWPRVLGGELPVPYRHLPDSVLPIPAAAVERDGLDIERGAMDTGAGAGAGTGIGTGTGTGASTGASTGDAAGWNEGGVEMQDRVVHLPLSASALESSLRFPLSGVPASSSSSSFSPVVPRSATSPGSAMRCAELPASFSTRPMTPRRSLGSMDRAQAYACRSQNEPESTDCIPQSHNLYDMSRTQYDLLANQGLL
jgi:hypothetical protein